jgi:hypothetical protein
MKEACENHSFGRQSRDPGLRTCRPSFFYEKEYSTNHSYGPSCSYVHPWVEAAHLKWKVTTVFIRLGFLLFTGSSWGYNQWTGRVKVHTVHVHADLLSSQCHMLVGCQTNSEGTVDGFLRTDGARVRL